MVTCWIRDDDEPAGRLAGVVGECRGSGTAREGMQNLPLAARALFDIEDLS